jgi:hypothetical protein
VTKDQQRAAASHTGLEKQGTERQRKGAAAAPHKSYFCFAMIMLEILL